jgi:UDP-GlcNAc:undecaprenyl-phosphate GlcNAc-1-phosphate transferase
MCLCLFAMEILYFRIAGHYNIIDKPNHRSSHTDVTLRGGGIIFVIGMLFYPAFFCLQYEYFLIGLLLIASVSFMDDIKPVSRKLRIIIHLLAVSLMLYQLGIFSLPPYWILISLFVVIGSINAVNFMDGINGITGAYALVTLCSLLYINSYIINFTDFNLIATAITSVLVFNFFNFRTKAKCFAGDVGSVAIAFIILFLLFKLIIISHNFSYILLLLLYGLDTATTMGFRMWRRERIQDAHRSHLYQYLANERKSSHLIVAATYALVQLFVNLSIINWASNSIFVLFIILISSLIIFIVIRFIIEGSSKLLDH